MGRVRVKICGITNVEDAMLAIEAGADALGFVFASSLRRITPEEARNIIAHLPPMVQKIGVFVDENPETINSISDFCSLDWIQLHGSEPARVRELINRPVIKGLRIKDESSLQALETYNDYFLLLDSYHPEKSGGTGIVSDWDLVSRVARQRPIILAGGLNAENISEAIGRVKPYAVDASSGIESYPGKKDRSLVKQFITRAKEIEHVT